VHGTTKEIYIYVRRKAEKRKLLKKEVKKRSAAIYFLDSEEKKESEKLTYVKQVDDVKEDSLISKIAALIQRNS